MSGRILSPAETTATIARLAEQQRLADVKRERLLLARCIVHEYDCGVVTPEVADMTTTERRESIALARRIVAEAATPGAGT